MLGKPLAVPKHYHLVARLLDGVTELACKLGDLIPGQLLLLDNLGVQLKRDGIRDLKFLHHVKHIGRLFPGLLRAGRLTVKAHADI